MRLRSEAMCTSSSWCSSDEPSYHGMFARALDDVVAVQRRDRDEREVVHVELGRELAELVPDAFEDLLVVVDEVHLVDAQHEVRDAEQRREERVPPRLLDDAVAARRRGSARGRQSTRPVTMLRVYWMWPGVSAMMNLRVGRREVAVRDVDRDALFPFGPQAVGEQREVHALFAAQLRTSARALRACPRRSASSRRADDRSA